MRLSVLIMLATFGCLTLPFASQTSAQKPAHATASNPFIGNWWLEFDDGYGGALEITSANGAASDDLDVKLLWRVGSLRKMKDASVSGNVLTFSQSRRGKLMRYRASIDGDTISVQSLSDDIVATSQGASTGASAGERVVAKGQRCPPMPLAPDLAEVRFGEPIELFNGNDLSGWSLQPADAKNGWSVADGVLINETTKTDFSAYGDYGNLRTDRVMGDGRYQIEFQVGEKCNSGIYIRGLYEVQVVDRDSPMQGINGPGAIFGRVAPIKNAGLPGGEWQRYDVTLVDRHMSVTLNGQKVIDNQPVAGCTGGALMGNVTADGPLYLQGDHTSVRYRNLRFSPRVN